MGWEKRNRGRELSPIFPRRIRNPKLHFSLHYRTEQDQELWDNNASRTNQRIFIFWCDYERTGLLNLTMREHANVNHGILHTFTRENASFSLPISILSAIVPQFSPIQYDRIRPISTGFELKQHRKRCRSVSNINWVTTGRKYRYTT